MAAASSVSKQSNPPGVGFQPPSKMQGAKAAAATASSAVTSVAAKVIPKLADVAVGTPDFPHFAAHVDSLNSLENSKARKVWGKKQNSVLITPELREDISLIRAGRCEEDANGNIFVTKKQKQSGEPITRVYSLHLQDAAPAAAAPAKPKNRVFPRFGTGILPFTGAEERQYAKTYQKTHFTSFRAFLTDGMQTDPKLKQLHEESVRNAEALYAAHQAACATAGVAAGGGQASTPATSGAGNAGGQATPSVITLKRKAATMLARGASTGGGTAAAAAASASSSAANAAYASSSTANAVHASSNTANAVHVPLSAANAAHVPSVAASTTCATTAAQGALSAPAATAAFVGQLPAVLAQGTFSTLSAAQAALSAAVAHAAFSATEAAGAARAASPNGLSPLNTPVTPPHASAVSRRTPEGLSLSSRASPAGGAVDPTRFTPSPQDLSPAAASKVPPEPPQLNARPPAVLTPAAIKSPPLNGGAKRALFSSPLASVALPAQK